MSNKMKVDCFDLLPDDLILDILQKLPSDILRYKTRFVCKRWFKLITDNILLDHGCLILETPAGCQNVRLMDISEDKEGLKMKAQYLDIPYNGRIKSWCNEFLLITNFDGEGPLYIFNLITKEGSYLPSCSIPCGGHHGFRCGMGLSYDKFNRVYKVVHVFNGHPIQSELLICGTSNWKKIRGPSYTGWKYGWADPVSVQGRYFHWDVYSSKHLASMDTVKERFRQLCLPASEGIPTNNQYTFVEMGGFLTLLHKVSYDTINIWMLKDFQRTKWEKLHSVCVPSDVSSIVYPDSALPLLVTSLKSKRYLISRKPGETGLYGYDLKGHFMEKLDFDIAREERCVVHSWSFV